MVTVIFLSFFYFFFYKINYFYLKPLYSLPPLSLAVSSKRNRLLWCEGGNEPGPEGEELFGAGDDVRWGGVARPKPESVSVKYLEL